MSPISLHPVVPSVSAVAWVGKLRVMGADSGGTILIVNGKAWAVEVNGSLLAVLYEVCT